MRALGDAWAVGRRAEGGRELYLVLERKGDTLLETAEAAAAFADEHFPGVFL